MPAGFSRTFRGMEQDGMWPTALALGFAVALLGGWAGWLALARVSLYEVSETARLEVAHIYPVAAPITGRVVAAGLVLSREVQQGEVLVEVEADREHLETAEERARLAAFGPQLQALAQELRAEEQALHELRNAGAAAVSEAQQKRVAAEAAARQAQDQAERARQLQQRDLVPQADLVKTRAEAEARRADLGAASVGIERLRSEQRTTERTREARLAALRREQVNLEGQRDTLRSVVARREREAERRSIRASVAGRLGDVTPLQVGAVIREGDRLASIIPDGHVRVVAEFPPTALGRTRPGQPARLRLDGFPWLQYGRLSATVTRIASEPREGRVRVELALERVANLPKFLQHGLPVTVEVEVERVAPVVLLLRAAGYVLAVADPRPQAPVPPRSAESTANR
jgi:multidrug resistance efflux pump